MKTLTHKIFKATLVLSALALLSACGVKNEQDGGINFSSRLPVDQAALGTKDIAYCNKAESPDLTVRTHAYIEGNTVRMDYVFARITSLPANFADSTHYISMWKWLADSTTGATSVDQEPLMFQLILRNGTVITEGMTTLRWSDVQELAASHGYTNPTSFFNNVNILVNLRDTYGDYDVLRVSYYGSSNTEAASVDGLLPPFHANPAHYAVEASGAPRASVLNGLHPFKGMNSSYNFVAAARSFCLN